MYSAPMFRYFLGMMRRKRASTCCHPPAGQWVQAAGRVKRTAETNGPFVSSLTQNDWRFFIDVVWGDTSHHIRLHYRPGYFSHLMMLALTKSRKWNTLENSIMSGLKRKTSLQTPREIEANQAKRAHLTGKSTNPEVLEDWRLEDCKTTNIKLCNKFTLDSFLTSVGLRVSQNLSDFFFYCLPFDDVQHMIKYHQGRACCKGVSHFQNATVKQFHLYCAGYIYIQVCRKAHEGGIREHFFQKVRCYDVVLPIDGWWFSFSHTLPQEGLYYSEFSFVKGIGQMKFQAFRKYLWIPPSFGKENLRQSLHRASR